VCAYSFRPERSDRRWRLERDSRTARGTGRFANRLPWPWPFPPATCSSPTDTAIPEFWSTPAEGNCWECFLILTVRAAQRPHTLKIRLSSRCKISDESSGRYGSRTKRRNKKSRADATNLITTRSGLSGNYCFTGIKTS